jgi:hypothetical protein
MPVMATWRSGYAAVCKTVYPGSIPGVASTREINHLAANAELLVMGWAGAREPERRRRDCEGAVPASSRARPRLASSPLGCTEATRLAQGFTVETLGRRVLDGFATATPGTVQGPCMPVGGRLR